MTIDQAEKLQEFFLKVREEFKKTGMDTQQGGAQYFIAIFDNDTIMSDGFGCQGCTADVLEEVLLPDLKSEGHSKSEGEKKTTPTKRKHYVM